MKNKDIKNILQNIKELIIFEEYGKVIEYIDKILAEVPEDEQLSSKYIDELVSNLK